MRPRLVSALAASLALALIAMLGSVDHVLAQTSCQASLNGAQETPPVVTGATGSGSVVLDAAETSILVNLTFQNLTSTQTLAHIHGPAPAGTAAGIRVTLPLGQITNQTFPVPDATFASDLKAGLTYFNVHTQNFPNGEIRGQIICSTTPVVPELSTVVMFGTGLAGLGGYALTRARAIRRRRD